MARYGLDHMSLLKTGETPRAAFGTSEKLRGGPDREIPRMLSQYLSVRFATSQPKRIMFFRPWSITVDSEPNSIEIAIGRSKFIENGWRLLAMRTRLPYILSRSKPPRYDRALLEVCREIHFFLAQTPGIVDVRWYFQGSEFQTRAVRTPDELSWHES
jgi:hypothetical protein